MYSHKTKPNESFAKISFFTGCLIQIYRNIYTSHIQIRRPGSSCTVFFSYVASKILSQGAHPKSPVQNPKSKIPKIQNPKSPNSKIQTLHIKICYIMFQKSKIQNPQNPKIQNPQNPQNPKSPKSKIPKIQNPQNPKSPQSKIQNHQKPPKIQNPKSPKSKIPKIQNPKSPKSKIKNPPPKSKIWGVGGLT